MNKYGLSKDTHLFLDTLSVSDKDQLYRYLWAEYVEEDVTYQLMENGPCLSKKDRKKIVASVTRKYVYDGKYDCNLSYWDNIHNLIELEIRDLEELASCPA